MPAESMLTLRHKLCADLEPKDSHSVAYYLLDSCSSVGDVPQYDSIDVDLANLLGDADRTLSNESNYVDELSGLQTQITEVIDCLLRLSVTLNDPAPHDQFLSQMGGQTTRIEPHDIRYVQETFPNLDSDMSQRLGRAMIRRQQYIKYRAGRRSRLEEPLELDEAEHARRGGGGSTGFLLLPKNIRDSIQTDVTNSHIPVSETSAISYARSDTADASEIRIPPLPKKDTGGRRLCPFCLMLISAENQDDWK